jgi:hypothetical protein
MSNENLEGDSIDFITVADNPGWVVLHLVVTGPWDFAEARMHWVRRRLNVYVHYVETDQINANPKYRGLTVKFVAHCEFPPPPLAVTAFARMKKHLAELKIELGVTVGTDFKTEIPVWEIMGEREEPPDEDINKK